MGSMIIDSKLSAPDCGPMLVRSRLIDLIENNHAHRLKLICADAGYGKTILMGQLFALSPNNSIWYQLDRFDCDFRVFISHLVTGLQPHIPGFGEWVNERLNESNSSSGNQGEVLRAFVSELVDKTDAPVHIFLDDFHLVNESGPVNEATRFLIDHLHNGSSVTISTRERPTALSLGRLKARSELVEISKADLRFSTREVKNLFQKTYRPLKEKEIIELHRKTDGWAVALALSGNFLSETGDAASLGGLQVKINDIHEYLSEEIWASIDEEKKDFFMKVSLVETIDVGLIKDIGIVAEGKKVHKILEDAVNRNMMIVSLGEGRYRLHPLYRGLLEEKLITEMGSSKIAELHRGYANAFLKCKKEEDAVDHLIFAGDHDRAIEIIIACGDDVIDSGFVSKAEKWVSNLKRTNVSDGWLDYFAARIKRFNGHLSEASQLGLGAYERFSQENNKKGKFSCAFYLSDLFGLYEDYEESLKFASVALDNTDDPEEMAAVMNTIAACKIWQGRLSEATDLLDKAKKIVGHSNKCSLLNELVMLNISFLMGNFNVTLNEIKEIDNRADWSCHTFNKVRFLSNYSVTLYLLGKYDESLVVVNEAMELARKTGANFEALGLQEVKSLLSLCKDDPDEGLSAIIATEKNFIKAGRKDIYATVHKGTCYRRLGKINNAIDAHRACLEQSRAEHNMYLVAMNYANIGADKQRKSVKNNCPNELGVAEAYARKFGFKYVLTQVYFHYAWRAYIKKRFSAAKIFLEVSLGLAARNSHNHFIIQEGKISLALLIFALEQGIEVDYLVQIFGKIGAVAINELRPLTEAKTEDIRLIAARALLSAGGLQVAPLIRRLLRDKDKRVRMFADEALGHLRTDMSPGEQLLTRREQEVFELLGKGLSNAEIGEKLFISEQTVKTHVTRIFRKLGLTRRSQAVIHLQNNGLPAS